MLRSPAPSAGAPRRPPSASAAAPAVPAAPAFPYPPTQRGDQVDALHGVQVPDPYRWLEDGQSADVKKWADDQNTLTRDYTAKLPGREALAARFKELFYVESAGTPRLVGNRLFYPRRDAGKEKATIYWRARERGRPAGPGARAARPERVVDRRQRLARRVERLVRRQEGRLHREGEQLRRGDALRDGRRHRQEERRRRDRGREVRVAFVDAVERRVLLHLAPASRGAVSTADRPGYAEVRLHKLGSDPSKDRIVHEKTGDPKTFVSAGVGKDGRWLIATIEHGWTSTDVYFQDLRSPKPEWRPLVVGVDARYDVSVDGDRFFVWTNEGASRYRVFRVDPAHPARDQWKEIVPERADATLEAVTIVGHRLSLGYLKDVVSHLELRDEDGKLVREIELPDPRLGLGPERRGRRRRRLLLVQVVHVSDRDLRDERQERDDVDLLQAQGPGRPVEVRGRAALRDEQGRDEGALLRRARSGPGEDGQHARDALRLRRLPGGADACVLVVDLSVARERGHLGRRQPPRRQRVRRGMAPPGDAARQAARLRRLLRRRRGAREAGVHAPRQARGARRVERRAPRRRGDHAAARPLSRRALRGPACSTWCATTSSAAARRGSRSTARRTTPTTSRRSSRTRRTITSRRGRSTPRR